jgi:hypothetical protein
MMTKQKYVEYLLSTPNHYTCPKLAEHWEGVSQDAVSDFWQRERLTPRPRGERMQGRIDDPSSVDPLKRIHGRGWTFFTPLKREAIAWTPQRLPQGGHREVQRRAFPRALIQARRPTR